MLLGSLLQANNSGVSPRMSGGGGEGEEEGKGRRRRPGQRRVGENSHGHVTTRGQVL